MTKKRIFISLFIVILFGLTSYYLNLVSQVSLLKNHYPVFSKEKESYILSTKKPRGWTKLNEISKEAKFAIVISEDWAFFDHNGIDLNQLKIVLKESIKEKELTRGASTITQQVVKNAFLSNERSLFRKAKEILLARELEASFSKNEILEIYLNLIELGDNIYGVNQASYAYFNKSPSELDAKEGAFLAMLLPSPVRYSESFKKKRLTNFAKERIEDILLKLRKAKVITEDKRVLYLSERLSFEEYDEDIPEFSENEKEELEKEISKDL